MASAVSLLLIYVTQAVTFSLIITCNTASSIHGTDSLFNSLNTKDLNKCPQDKQWFCFNSTTRAYSCDQAAVSGRIMCSDDGPIMGIGNCATYDENTQVLSISKCLNQAEISDYNRSSWGISLPTVLTELNDYMCGPLSRKGLVCSECADSFGPSVTSFGYSYKCVNCTNAGYGVAFRGVCRIQTGRFLHRRARNAHAKFSMPRPLL